MKEESRLKLTVRKHATRDNPGEFETIEIKLEPELMAITQALAAELSMSPEEFGSVIFEAARARQN